MTTPDKKKRSSTLAAHLSLIAESSTVPSADRLMAVDAPGNKGSKLREFRIELRMIK